MKTLLITGILLVTASGLVRSQNIDSIVTAAADEFMRSGPRVGVSVGVIVKGKEYRSNAGLSDKTKKLPPSDNTIFEIGSITKTFTSGLLATAVMEKKVALTDDIRKYLKGEYPNLQFEGKPIQLLHLADLTSALPDNLPEKPPAGIDGDSIQFKIKKFHDGYSRDQFLKDLHTVTMNRAPGLITAHSNTAAQLLGYILENIYGKRYESLVAENITVPLKMSSTFVTVPDAAKLHLAAGYNPDGKLMPVIPIDAGSAGALTSTIIDMLKYARYHLEEKDPSVILSHKPYWGNANSGVGLSWRTAISFDGKRKVWTSGGTFGFASYCIVYPERGFAVVALSNENDGSAEDALSGIAQHIYDQVYFTKEERASDAFGFSSSVHKLLDQRKTKSFDEIIDAASSLKKNDPAFALSEDELNNWGYAMLGKGEKATALNIFKLNVALFPKSANVWDSLAETYESLGNKAEAIKNYQHVLELDPASENAAAHLKGLLK